MARRVVGCVLALLVLLALPSGVAPANPAPCSVWPAATRLAGAQWPVQRPAVEVDSAGNALAVWAQSNGSVWSVWGARFSSSSGWDAPEPLEFDDAGDAASAAVGVDDAGNALAAWVQSNGTRDSVWANRYAVGSGWSGPELLEAEDGGDATAPRLAVNGAGVALAVWGQSNGTAANLTAARYLPGTGWGSPVGIATNLTSSAAPADVAMDGSGRAAITWTRFAGTWQAWVSLFDGSTWAPPMELESGSGSAFSPAVAMDSAGNVTTVWTVSDPFRSVWSQRFTNAGGWETPLLLETYTAGDSERPTVGADEGGEVWVAWEAGNGTYSGIWARRWIPGQGWQAPVSLGAGPQWAFAGALVAVGPGGRAAVVWRENGYLAADRFHPLLGWGGRLLPSATPGLAGEHSVEARGAVTVLLWTQGDEYTKDTVWAIVLRDTDGDGISDEREVALGLNALSGDTDTDGVTDGEEACLGLGDPLLRDTDGDGLDDGLEHAARTGTYDSDSDDDGSVDGQDKFPLNPGERADLDGDGIGNNADGDDDGDGWPDIVEAAAGSDALNATSKPPDLDGDGIADIFDADMDGDAVLDAQDAYPTDPTRSERTLEGGPTVFDWILLALLLVVLTLEILVLLFTRATKAAPPPTK